MQKYYLGVDGGQSSTIALIADEHGRIVGHGRGGPCNHVAASEGRARFIKGLGEALRHAGKEACFDARISQFAAACLGFSGGAEDKALYTRELLNSARFHITHDAEIALTGATGGEPGIIVIAGTGSIAFGRNASGQTARAGGWGYIFGDEGGAFDIARHALRAALQMEEGWGAATLLHDLLLKATNATSADLLMRQFYANFDRTAVARLAPIVSEAAEQADPAAIQILRNAATNLAALAKGVAHLFQNGRPKVAFIGGVFESPLLRQQFQHLIQSELQVDAMPPLYPPAAGALIQALRLDNNPSSLSNLPDIKK